MPELPSQKRARYSQEYGLSEYDVQVLTATKELGTYFEEVVASAGDPKMAANWVMGDLMASLKAEGKDPEIVTVNSKPTISARVS